MSFRIARSNIGANKLRSSLAVLGIMIGTASVMTMLSLTDLASKSLLQHIQELGLNIMRVQTHSYQSSKNAHVTLPFSVQGLHELKHQVAKVNQVAGIQNLSVTAKVGRGQHYLNVLATDARIVKMLRLSLDQGRFIRGIDGNLPYVVVGQHVAKWMGYAHTRSIVGQSIKLGNQYFTVVGLLHQVPQYMMVSGDLNRSVLVSFSAMSRLNIAESLDTVYVRYRPVAAMQQVAEQLTRWIKHHTGMMRVLVQTPQQMLGQLAEGKKTFDWLLGAIGGVSLLVGGIGIMNIMLVSVMERRHEIGIRMAVGARGRDVALMFLQEAIVLALTGGVLGVGLGLLITWMVALYAGWTFSLLLWPISLAVGVALFCGLFFGFYPAWKASKLQPIEALRQLA
jgi:putative ABC transport system permease protein